ncbi:glutamyl-tRNA(Gln) amidotransferase subunit A [Lysinibacillus sp. PLM2]|nr:glutamyl-tRNA(Gln) amidotransferase subunit A [Lysinibacillus sp. PLM2]
MELTQLSLCEVAKQIRLKKVSPVELVEECIKKIQIITHKNFSAYIDVYEKESLKKARDAEREIMSGNYYGLLHGIPIALKDNIAMKGFRTTAGSKILSNWIPKVNSTVVTRLESVGTIIIGKTNLHEFAWGATSENPHYGIVRNPWDPKCNAAGSSGGSAVAVVTKSCFGALGTDTGGSIRLPAAVTGIVGLRPTYGSVSNHGVIPLAKSMDTVGPMTRNVKDCAILHAAINSNNQNDNKALDIISNDYMSELDKELKGLRMGILSDYFQYCQPSVTKNIKKAISTLMSHGVEIIDVQIGNLEDIILAKTVIQSSEASAYHQKNFSNNFMDYGEDVRIRLDKGERYLATEYIHALEYRKLLKSQFMEAFQSVDAFILPTLPFVARNIGDTTISIKEGQDEEIGVIVSQFTGIASLTGFPALNLPCGFDEQGLPTGMQIIGKPFEESLLFRIGQAYQQVTNFHLKSPAL